MDDIGVPHLAVGINILHAELLGKEHIYLDGDERIFLAEHVLDLDIELGSVECSLVYTDLIIKADIIEYLLLFKVRFIFRFIYGRSRTR